MKLSLKEARKRATPGKLGDALGVLVAKSGKRLPLSDPRKPLTTDEECANAALLKHCWNRFDEVVAALEDMLFQFDGTGYEDDKDRECIERAAAVLTRAKEVETP